MHTALRNALLTLLLTGTAAGTACAAGAQSSTSHYNNTTLAAQASAAVGPRYAIPLLAAPSTIPEPPVYIMLLIGVGLVGLVARRQAPPPKFTDET
ncbi:PEP-CTERM sorting domain-containing protein [Pseudoduganella namucuonensis]|uniref:PEP-CTERM protein-sorting domain-containing protein n=1 Tax=Pseudoduganella namucuonensis TaxID=1035707 RepID=A0A1I7IZ82_9BURK|nr:PEP-CTERM sorting domain-containing protein [Pseudoduganella namucuonensis]SFU78194.1 PEP-CTERM protein-sorting domain-containing protein [Pseudoduganella namucuonensis]